MSKSDTVVPRCLSGTLEPTHNHGMENLETTPYRSGNEEPKRFDHITISVPDVEAACARFESLGVTCKNRLKDGKMKFLAFILDPDRYWIEVVRLRLSFAPVNFLTNTRNRRLLCSFSTKETDFTLTPSVRRSE